MLQRNIQARMSSSLHKINDEIDVLGIFIFSDSSKMTRSFK